MQHPAEQEEQDKPTGGQKLRRNTLFQQITHNGHHDDGRYPPRQQDQPRLLCGKTQQILAEDRENKGRSI